MRLICPNCDAEYEVEASVIPAAGRDVQCSNCGHSWFQLPPEIEAEAEAEAALYDDAPMAGAEAPLPDPTEAVAAVAETPAARIPAPQNPALQNPPPQSRAASAAPHPARPPAAPPIAALETSAPEKPMPETPALVARTLDETVLAVLREEAEREAVARRTEGTRAPVVETQTEMGLVPATSLAGAAARRVAQLKGVDPDAAARRPPTRREMLPEIDEINSSLRASSEKRSGESAAVAATMPVEVPSRRSFRSGFVLMMVIAVIGVVAYVMAPRITERIPGAGPALTTYVGAVDSARLRLDASLQALIAALRSMTKGEG